MPTYEYACKKCGEHIEVVQSFTDKALTKCPSCKGELRKVFGSIGITFKGSGFYKTDSRTSSTSGTKSEPSESTKSEPAAAKSDTKSDTGKKDTPAKKDGPSSSSTSTSSAAAS